MPHSPGRAPRLFSSSRHRALDVRCPVASSQSGSKRRLGLAPLRSAVVSSPLPPKAAAEPDRMPELPPDALVLTSSDEATWRLEIKEYKALAADPAQQSFVPLLDSFKLQVKEVFGGLLAAIKPSTRQRLQSSLRTARE